ncbi:hypothetical protein P152DRAFT_262417 [Eremomyces bilateralis CBS 781.70]|uniref:Zn(2)-C6 fungal-type domain-containing protein n=1 Tax=Eremomyces bilateralis CBS 781.70 TaxID=1392243 RepID=A0A6G1G8C5_9PEZI|nr:uncharacterized protein P152DRAFT_262417 [Eremomyces bilateralis CBS 781.70]KAF1814150.1 hypothetical protein P152DRAFT_262417 [Eremomyces bilateralis CBS 781.70]
MSGGEDNKASVGLQILQQPADPNANKSRRVRTGCLTCRERHLKCDETIPICLNCKKSQRQCKYGVKLNFIDTSVSAPPIVANAHDWTVSFVDESRLIASEYKGGEGRYAPLEDKKRLVPNVDSEISFQYSVTAPPPVPVLEHSALPPMMLPETYPDDTSGVMFERRDGQHGHGHSHTHSIADSAYGGSTGGVASSYSAHDPNPSAEGRRDYLNTQEEVLFMQVFVEEVGIWMDSMDPHKHFSRLLPFHALSEPMLLNAFLACGARHLSLVNEKYNEDKALSYYDTATRYLLNALQNPARDVVICATTAVILNVYEIMCERALQRMNHIAGARALIKECGWNARSTGIGAACFWLNVGMELLSCLHFNWQVAWDPDDWGVDMDFSHENPVNTDQGREELWTYRIMYIIGKTANFRATIPRKAEASPSDEQMRTQRRYAEWERLRDWAEGWNKSVPRSMHPMGYLYPYQTMAQSVFPEVWLIKRTAIVARLFYHTTMLLLGQVNPLVLANSASPQELEDMHNMVRQHSVMICGITAHVKDRGVASVGLRSLAIAAETLTDRREQEEVLHIFDRIRQETGWRIGFVQKELREKWAWDEPLHLAAEIMPTPPSMQPFNSHSMSALGAQPTSVPSAAPLPTRGHSPGRPLGAVPVTSAPAPAPPPAQARRKPPSGILNPLLATADFSLAQHPYQSVYVPAITMPGQPGGATLGHGLTHGPVPPFAFDRAGGGWDRVL